MKRIALVFRSVGERTRDLALELATRSLRPDVVHSIENVRPFSAAVEHMLGLGLDADGVVAVDADCLILEDMRPFLDANRELYVGCRVEDRFRGLLPMGVHVYRRELLDEMRVGSPDPDNMAYVLRPETWRRRRALERLGHKRVLTDVRILHDHFQAYEDVFAKYGQRELRARSKRRQRENLEQALAGWGEDPDLRVARAAVEHARASVPEAAPPDAVRRYLEELPRIARSEVERLGLPPQAPIAWDAVRERAAEYGWTV